MRTLGVLLVIGATVAQAGLLDNLPSSLSDLTSTFGTVSNLFAGDQGGLLNNIGRVKDLLSLLQNKAPQLEPLANDAQKSALSRVGGFLSDVTQFGQKVSSDGAQKFDENRGVWEGLVRNVFEAGGVQSLVKLLAKANSAGQSAAAISAVLIAPLVAMLL